MLPEPLPHLPTQQQFFWNQFYPFCIEVQPVMFNMQNLKFPSPASSALPAPPRPEGLDSDNLHNKEEFLRFIESFADKDNYLCQICLDVLWEPMQCKHCTKLFCGTCIKNYMMTVNNNNKKCPSCRVLLQVKKADAYIVNNLCKLKFACPNTRSGCPEIINYEFLSKHNKECQYTLKTCDNAGCTQQILKIDQ